MPTSIRHPSGMRLWAYLTAAAVPAAGVALCLLLIVALISFITRLEAERLQNGRASVILIELQEQLETDLGLGFTLAESTAVQQLLEKSITLDATIRAIEVMDDHGLSLFNTDRGAIGEYAPQHWLRQMHASRTTGKNTGWSVNDATERTLAVPIKGAFGEVQGYVAITYTRDRYVDQSGFLNYAICFCIVVSSLVAAAGAWLSRHRLQLTLAAFEKAPDSAISPHAIVERTKRRLDDASSSLNGSHAPEREHAHE